MKHHYSLFGAFLCFAAVAFFGGFAEAKETTPVPSQVVQHAAPEIAQALQAPACPCFVFSRGEALPDDSAHFREHQFSERQRCPAPVFADVTIKPTVGRPLVPPKLE